MIRLFVLTKNFLPSIFSFRPSIYYSVEQCANKKSRRVKFNGNFRACVENISAATDDGKPDFKFMEAFTKNKFAEILKRVLEKFSG
ncbi:MAG: hypothetical protein IKP64_10515 [Selenomonadaceae bacterium]|nr:hypothetical protein [Selenomonadaceae bacterium]